MNKKVLLLTLMLLAMLTLAMVPVQAKPGAEKNNAKFLYYEMNLVLFTDPSTWEIRTSPPGLVPPIFGGTEPCATHIKAYDLTPYPDDPIFGYFTVQIDETTYYLPASNFEAEFSLQSNYIQTISNIRIKETYTFNANIAGYPADVQYEGTLEIFGVSRYDDKGTPELDDDTDEGTIVGHGTGYLKGVKISASSMGVSALKTHIGTITGWPDLPTP